MRLAITNHKHANLQKFILKSDFKDPSWTKNYDILEITSIFYFRFAHTGIARDYKKEARECVMEWESGHILSKERILN